MSPNVRGHRADKMAYATGCALQRLRVGRAVREHYTAFRKSAIVPSLLSRELVS